jgi:hypothetical protein
MNGGSAEVKLFVTKGQSSSFHISRNPFLQGTTGSLYPRAMERSTSSSPLDNSPYCFAITNELN